MKETINDAIEKIINKFGTADNDEVFRLELELLVIMAEKEQLKKDYESRTQ